MRQIDAWTDIFESHKRVISNLTRQNRGSLVKGNPCQRPKLPRIDDNGLKILLAWWAYQW